MKTGCVALVLCLNISVDPPDVIKISPCARMECWIGLSLPLISFILIFLFLQFVLSRALCFLIVLNAYILLLTFYMFMLHIAHQF